MLLQLTDYFVADTMKYNSYIAFLKELCYYLNNVVNCVVNNKEWLCDNGK